MYPFTGLELWTGILECTTGMNKFDHKTDQEKVSFLVLPRGPSASPSTYEGLDVRSQTYRQGEEEAVFPAGYLKQI